MQIFQYSPHLKASGYSLRFYPVGLRKVPLSLAHAWPHSITMGTMGGFPVKTKVKVKLHNSWCTN